MAAVKSTIRFHIETFGKDMLEVESPVLEAFVAEAEAVGLSAVADRLPSGRPAGVY